MMTPQSFMARGGLGYFILFWFRFSQLRADGLGQLFSLSALLDIAALTPLLWLALSLST